MKFYVTTPIYYVNAKPHIGSAYPTIAADVLARWHRLRGHTTRFLTGTAEHGTKIARAAQQAGQTPQEFADSNAAQFKIAWAALNISYDDFIRTTESRHEAAVTLFFNRLKESGKIYEGEYTGLYCVGHEAFIKESDLAANGLCPDHQKPPEKVKEKNWFFKLSDYSNFLRDKISSGELCIEPQIRRNEVLSFINQELEDIAISRQNVSWAIPLPWDKNQTIYVWLDELFNYCSAVGYGLPADKKGARGFSFWWPADLHLVGKDIIKFHCVIWPALLVALGEALPKKVFAHGFFTVNGQKISKSLGNAIDPVELVSQYGADAIRYFLLRDIPFGHDGDFSPERLKDRYNADLANGLGNLVSRVLNMFEQYQVAAPLPHKESGELLAIVDSHIAALAFDKALAAIWSVIAQADQLIEETKPWAIAKKISASGSTKASTRSGHQRELEKVLSQLYATLVVISAKIAPFMPAAHAKLTKLLAARPLKKPAEPLFARQD